MRQIITTSLTLILAVWMLVAQPALSQTNENPLTSREFWAEMKHTDNWQEIVQGHIDAGWDIQEIHPNHGTTLHSVVLEGFVEAIPKLIEYGVDVNTINRFKSTALHYASIFARDEDNQQMKAVSIEMVQTLIDAGAYLNVPDINGAIPLHEAFGWGSVETINLLIDAGADQTIVDNKNQTPFQMIQFDRGRPVWGSI